MLSIAEPLLEAEIRLSVASAALETCFSESHLGTEFVEHSELEAGIQPEASLVDDAGTHGDVFLSDESFDGFQFLDLGLLLTQI
jgi:hypothetical protein